MFSINEMKEAIGQGNFIKVKEITMDWEKNNCLKENLNKKYIFEGGNALIWAIYDLCEDPDGNIFSYLLSLRDSNNAPLIDINESYQEQTPLSLILDKSLIRCPEKLRYEILKLLLEQKDEHGNHLIDIKKINVNNHGTKPLLTLSINLGFSIFQLLLGLKDISGQLLLNCNERYKGKPLLDDVLSNQQLLQEDRDKLERSIRQYGGYTKEEDIQLKRKLYLEKLAKNYESKAELHIQLGLDAIHYVQKICYLGAMNRPKDIKRDIKLKDKGMDQRSSLLSELMNLCNHANTIKYRIPVLSLSSLVHHTGLCDEQTSLAIIYLLSRGIFNLAKIESESQKKTIHKGKEEPDYHSFFVIGMPDYFLETPDYTKLPELADDVIAVDPWNKVCFPIKEYLKKCELLDLKPESFKITYAVERDGLANISSIDNDPSYRKAFSSEVKRLLNREDISNSPLFANGVSFFIKPDSDIAEKNQTLGMEFKQSL